MRGNTVGRSLIGGLRYNSLYNFKGSQRSLLPCSFPGRRCCPIGVSRHYASCNFFTRVTTSLKCLIPQAKDTKSSPEIRPTSSEDVIPDKLSESSDNSLEDKLSAYSDSSLEAYYFYVPENIIPAWGLSSISGLRQNMQEAIAAVPWFYSIPLTGDCLDDGISEPKMHLGAHFFGVYGGHGGSQVANYCQTHIHSALARELEVITANVIKTTLEDICEEEWRRSFAKVFLKVDDEVGGKAGPGPHVAPATCGSTAVVAIICPSYLVVANCGDSRAVLYRDTISMPLSEDHTPSREDEYARIEAAGGKVIQLKTGYSAIAKRNGKQLTAILALSRAIGYRYWKPWVIPSPEVILIPRTPKDRILVLASDGLWDVTKNQEVCEIAMERIRFWHQYSCVERPIERCDGNDPAANFAAEHLTNLALNRGSKDNISVLVIDLGAPP